MFKNLKFKMLLAMLFSIIVSRAAFAEYPLIPEGFPTMATTGLNGAGISVESLTPSEPIRVTEKGAIVELMHVTGGIIIEADSVVIRKCKITGGLYGINCVSGDGILIEDCEISDGLKRKGINANNCTIRRCDISGYQDCIWLRNNVRIIDCYFHDLYYFEGAHSDCMQSSGGSNYVISHNTIVPSTYQNAALIIQTMFTPVNNVLIENNFFSGGNYVLYMKKRDAGVFPQNCTIRNNIFEKDKWNFGLWVLEGEDDGVWNGSNATNWHMNNLYHTGEEIETIHKSRFALQVYCRNSSVIKEPDLILYDSGSVVELTAIADSGYCFEKWLNLEVDDFKNPEILVTINSDTLFATQCVTDTSVSINGGKLDSERFNLRVLYMNDKLLLDGLQGSAMDVECYTLKGKRIYSSVHNLRCNSLVLSPKDMSVADGMYIVQLSNDKVFWRGVVRF